MRKIAVSVAALGAIAALALAGCSSNNNSGTGNTPASTGGDNTPAATATGGSTGDTLTLPAFDAGATIGVSLPQKTSENWVLAGQLFTDQPMLQPVRESFASGIPIVWRRVNDLPDYVYFNHAVHVNHGVPCEACHGRVDQMPLTWRQQPLSMEWCLSCHRDPAPRLRPPGAVFAMNWAPGGDPRRQGMALINLMHIDPKQLTDCYVCHR